MCRWIKLTQITTLTPQRLILSGLSLRSSHLLSFTKKDSSHFPTSLGLVHLLCEMENARNL